MLSGQLLNEQQQVLLSDVQLTTSALERMRGLIGKAEPNAQQGLVIDPCNSVHMFFMPYPLDIIYLNSEWHIIKIISQLKPWRLSGSFKASKTLEIQAGRAQVLGLTVGQRLTWIEK